ncbi:hypothetical protein ULMA_20520 [Patiriisocius marinus]|uniref:Secretion system C-terminal sorting domain-containing protein n=1 Tax=Patiriisocius marinus TaxID=1397112 RepID=A0A5J4IY83_9FLAO|nr:T9SS type A sorting domain-containing protein [Patiriisocius marinus]GER59944.1 hypothetical protein ULMA_20520 [Patiriisocius marinus]
MKKTLLFLTLILGIFSSYSQYDCSQGDGTFRYGVKLYISNVESDFDKVDLINHIIALDNISSADLNILNEHITLVYKTFPSQNPHNTVTVFATTEIYTILNSLNNSIEFQYCVLNNCPMSDGTFHYYALLTLSEVPVDFNKDDFINFIVGLDNISNSDLAILNTSITSVYKAFPSVQSEFLRRVVYIEATAELFQILDDINNSIEHHECIEEAILNLNFYEKLKSSIVYPNPISDKSVIELNRNSTSNKIELINNLGQIIYQKSFSEKSVIELKNFPIPNGISFLKIYDLTNGGIEILKIIMDK